MKYKTDCEDCLFKQTCEILPGIESPRCTLGGQMFPDGLAATLCPLNRLLMEIEKAMEGGPDNG